MSLLGKIRLEKFLQDKHGIVTGQVVTDGKYRSYRNEYTYTRLEDNILQIQLASGYGDVLLIPSEIPLTEALVAFFGLYSGDGSKGTEDRQHIGVIKPSISFSQKEPNLVKFAVMQFQALFSHNISFHFSLGEDSAFFMAGEGLALLETYYGGSLPAVPELHIVKPNLNEKDKQYLKEHRPVEGTNEEHLAFYYYFKSAMEEILTKQKIKELTDSNVVLTTQDKVSASLRRPFKKGARKPGGSSRSDEIYLKGLNGMGELFLKILHEIEQSISSDEQISAFGLIEWNTKPSCLGRELDVEDFFTCNPYGVINQERPEFTHHGIELTGKWPRSGKRIKLKKKISLDPLFCYVSGLYLAEGSTPKACLFSMFDARPEGLSLGFTSTENESIALLLRALHKLFEKDECLSTWKVKVGSQYFPELVVIGLKHGVPMLRSGESGDGKMRTMEISLAIKVWALEVAPCLTYYADKYSHVEPTGAGVARIDISASSALCRWFFPILMYAVFGELYSAPVWGKE